MLNMKFPNAKGENAVIETQSNGEISEETLIFITGVHDVEHEISKRKKVIETQSNGEISEKTFIFITGVHDVEHEISKRKKVIETQSNGEIFSLRVYMMLNMKFPNAKK